jgi:hypothetical protein
MNRQIAVVFSIIIIGASLSGCMSESDDTTEESETAPESQISDLEKQTLLNQNKINELSKSINQSNENLTILSELLDNVSNNRDYLILQLQENISKIQILSTQIEQLLLQNSEMELTIEELETQLQSEPEDPITPKLLVITVDVEAGSNCKKLDADNATNSEITTCMYGIFGNQSAGIVEMMDIADEVGVKISFFVDVMEIYAYGDELIQVMQDIDSRGHDVQLHFHPSMINSTNWDIIQNSEEWNESGATRETYMTCWDQNTADFWFSKAMEIFDEANITRPIAYRSGAYRYCDTIIQAMANHNMTQSYNYNMFSSGRQNFTAGYLHNFQWENGVFEFPITYVKDTDGELSIYSRIDESTWSISVNDTFERYFENQSSTRVMTMILHSFSFLDKNESGQWYLKDQVKVDAFRAFMLNLSDEYTIVSSSELQVYLDDDSIEGEFKLPLRFLENECHRNEAPHSH